MTTNHRPARPGDFIIDRYFPDAPPERREEVREQLKRFVRVQYRIAKRLAGEQHRASFVGSEYDVSVQTNVDIYGKDR